MWLTGWSRTLATLAAFALVGSLSNAAQADDMSKTARPGCARAVDGINGKVSAWGGAYADQPLHGGTGALSFPLACEWGIQVDATGANYDGHFLGSAGGHLFWRNPAQGLLGLYGRYTYWGQVGGLTSTHIGLEGERYLGRFTLRGVAGIESGNTMTGVISDTAVIFSVATRFFDQVDLAYYLQDNVEVYAGHRYLGGRHALALGGEYGIPSGRMMTSMFVEGRFGDDNSHAVWGGVRLYFGDKDKTLIRRHREDDPTDWGGGVEGGATNGTAYVIPPE